MILELRLRRCPISFGTATSFAPVKEAARGDKACTDRRRSSAARHECHPHEACSSERPNRLNEPVDDGEQRSGMYTMRLEMFLWNLVARC
jgi:hypothetical protein